MKTVQIVLREADRDRLLDMLTYDILYDTQLLLELKDRTIENIQEACRSYMNAFIEYLLSLEAAPSDHMVLYMCEASSFDRAYNHEDKTLNLIDINEIRQDIYASSYGFEFSDWSEALGYLVADNKLTKDYLYVLLAQFLNEISFFGTDPEEHRKRWKKRMQIWTRPWRKQKSVIRFLRSRYFGNWRKNMVFLLMRRMPLRTA